VKKVRGEEENDPNFDLVVEKKGSRKQPRPMTLDEDIETPRLKVLASVIMLIISTVSGI
jgi:hypothetical protein